MSTLKLNSEDKIIISLLQDNPHMTYTKIAQIIKKSQPSVGNKIDNLRKKGFLNKVYGFNFKNSNFHLVKVELYTTNIQEILDEIKDSKYFLNAFTTTGAFNLLLLFCSRELKKVEKFINEFLRKREDVIRLRYNIITKVFNDLVLPINF